jgi:hypothetical protein
MSDTQEIQSAEDFSCRLEDILTKGWKTIVANEKIIHLISARDAAIRADEARKYVELEVWMNKYYTLLFAPNDREWMSEDDLEMEVLEAQFESIYNRMFDQRRRHEPHIPPR